MKRIELNEKVKNAWDSLVQRNNKIIDLLNKVYEKKGPLASIGTKNGFSVDVHRLADEKIRVDQFITTDMKITEDLVFHIDVFFGFCTKCFGLFGMGAASSSWY